MDAFREMDNSGRISPMIPINLEQHSLFNSNSKEFFIYLILESIKQENYVSAIDYYKMAQKHWPNDFARSNQHVDHIELDVILLLVCEETRMKYSSNSE